MTSQLSDWAANQPKQGWSQHTATCATDCATNHRGAEPPVDETLADKLARLEAENKRLRTRVEEAEDGWHGALLKLGKPIEQRSDHAVLVSIATLTEDTLGVQRHILKQLQTAAESRNVVEIDSNGSAGRIKVRVRCTGETLEDAHATAIEQFAQAMAEVEAGSVNGWAQTLDALAKRKSA